MVRRGRARAMSAACEDDDDDDGDNGNNGGALIFCKACNSYRVGLVLIDDNNFMEFVDIEHGIHHIIRQFSPF